MPRTTATDALRAPKPSATIQIPHLFAPRSYQKPPMQYMDGGGKRALTVWHRRAGKDLLWLNQTIKAMLLPNFCGTYLYIFPTLTQGRRDLWDAKTSSDSGGRPFRAHFPPELVMEASETEMQITLRPMPHQNAQPISDGRGGEKRVGSIFQVMGTDKDSIENLRGLNAAGAVFSEYSDQNPAAWESIVEPILMESKGWAAFDFTPKGNNHAKKLWDYACGNPAWFTQILTIEQTLRDAPGENGQPVIDTAQIEELRARGVPEEIIQQEYFCDFSGFLQGSIYGDCVKQAFQDKRVGQVPWVPNLPVGTMWDIGRTDATSILFFQMFGSEIRIIDYYANMRQGAEHYAKVCQQKPYLYGLMILPHDARVRGYTATESTQEFLERTVCRRSVIAEKLTTQEGISMVRRMFPRIIFNEAACEQEPNAGMPSLLAGLRGYHRKWDEDKGDYSGEPVHDKYSHPADALRTGIVGWPDGGMTFAAEMPSTPLKVETEFEPRDLSFQGGWR